MIIIKKTQWSLTFTLSLNLEERALVNVEIKAKNIKNVFLKLWFALEVYLFILLRVFYIIHGN